MQQFKALFNKEFGSYFRSYLAYIVFFVYLFVSIGCAFYFGSYLAMHDTALYALFYLQPIILTVFVPAITMKMWSEEFKSGTAEFLLTQPINYFLLVGVKSLSAFLFCFSMSLFFIPFILYTSEWMVVDWGNIILCYIGLWLLLLLFNVLGCFISSLNNNVILSYVLSVFSNVLIVSFSFTYLYETYNNFMFGEIGFSDFMYFIIFVVVFLILNVMAMNVRISVQKNKIKKFIFFAFLLIFCGVIFNVIFYNLCTSKVDFTSGQTYSFKKQTEDILDLVEEPINIDVYVAKDYISNNADYFHYFQQIKRFLNKFKNQSKGMINVNTLIVDPFSDLEEKVLESGLFFEDNLVGSKNYFGAVLRNKDGKEVIIKQFIRERISYLERDIDKALIKLILPDVVKTIGVYLDPTQNLDEFETFLIDLESDYNVMNVTDDTYEISSKMDLLILVNPKDLSSHFMYAIDQFIMNGGRTLIFFDFFSEKQSDLINMKDIKISKFLDQWNVLLRDEFIDDGKLNNDFGKKYLDLKINKAVSFNVENEDVNVIPFIQNEKGFIGAILTGTLTSLYKENPFKDTEFGQEMSMFLPYAIEGTQVALVGDVDLLNDSNWVALNSVDKNPYGVIESAGNGAAVRSLIDYMLENSIYQILPIKDEVWNKDSIGRKVEKVAFSMYADKIESLSKNIRSKKMIIYESVGQDIDKMGTLLQVGEAGRDIAKQEDELQSLTYKVKSEYSKIINKMILINVVFLPLFYVIILLCIISIANKWQKIKIKEKINA